MGRGGCGQQDSLSKPDRVEQLRDYVVKELSSCYPTFDPGAFDPGKFDSMLVHIVEVLVEVPVDSNSLAARVSPFSLDEKLILTDSSPVTAKYSWSLVMPGSSIRCTIRTRNKGKML